MRRFLNGCGYGYTQMPIYEYRCNNCGHEFETIQKLSDSPLTTCPACAEEGLRKKVSAAGFRLKGGGWYETDFKRGTRKNVAAGEASGAEGGDKNAAKEGSGGEKGGEKSDGAASKKEGAKSDSSGGGVADKAAAGPAKKAAD